MASPAGLYTETMTVQRIVSSVDNSGGWSSGTPTVKATGQLCRVQTNGAAFQSMNEEEGMIVNVTVFTDYSGTANGDQLVVDGTRVIRVTGAPIKRRANGNMDTFYVIRGMERIN